MAKLKTKTSSRHICVQCRKNASQVLIITLVGSVEKKGNATVTFWKIKFSATGKKFKKNHGNEISWDLHYIRKVRTPVERVRVRSP